VVAVSASEGNRSRCTPCFGDGGEAVKKSCLPVVTGLMPKFAVADFYRHWYDLSDDEIGYLKQWQASFY